MFVAGMLNTLTPIFTVIIGSVVFKIKFRNLATIGYCLVFIGAIVLMFAQKRADLGRSMFCFADRGRLYLLRGAT